MNTESERKNVNYMIVDTFIEKITQLIKTAYIHTLYVARLYKFKMFGLAYP